MGPRDNQAPSPGQPARSLAELIFDRARRQGAQRGVLRVERAGSDGPVSAVLSPGEVLEATQFDPSWGEPPNRPGLRWNPRRWICEPTWAPSPSPGASLGQDAARTAVLARAGIFRQWCRLEESRRAAWRLRWVRVFSELPDPATPYEVLADSDPALA